MRKRLPQSMAHEIYAVQLVAEAAAGGQRCLEIGLAEHIGVDAALRDDAALIISELFTNALIHTDSIEITCRVLAAPYTLYLSITDQGHGPTGPRVRSTRTAPDRDDAENGRGLLLVSALANTWGVATDPGHGRTVWAVLNLDAHGRAGRCSDD